MKSGRRVHKNGQIDQICALNCEIQQNGSNQTLNKLKNLFGVESILNPSSGMRDTESYLSFE